MTDYHDLPARRNPVPEGYDITQPERGADIRKADARKFSVADVIESTTVDAYEATMLTPESKSQLARLRTQTGLPLEREAEYLKRKITYDATNPDVPKSVRAVALRKISEELKGK